MTNGEQAVVIERTVRAVMQDIVLPALRDEVSRLVDERVWSIIKYEMPSQVFNAIHDARDEVIRQALSQYDISVTRREA